MLKEKNLDDKLNLKNNIICADTKQNNNNRSFKKFMKLRCSTLLPMLKSCSNKNEVFVNKEINHNNSNDNKTKKKSINIIKKTENALISNLTSSESESFR